MASLAGSRHARERRLPRAIKMSEEVGDVAGVVRPADSGAIPVVIAPWR
jgi:hypothetical protein